MSLGNIVDLRDKPPRFLSTPKLPLEPQKRTPLKQKRRRMRVLYTLLFFFLIALGVWGVSALSHLSYFEISTIGVSGNVNVATPDLFKAAHTTIHDDKWHYISRSNMFFFPEEEIREKILGQFPRIELVEMSRESLFGQQLDIRVVERNYFAAWCDTSCYLMDERGLIFAPFLSESTSTVEYVFEGGISPDAPPVGQNFAVNRFLDVLLLLDLLKDDGFYPSGVRLDNETDYWVRLLDGFYIKATFGQDIGALTRNLRLILGSEALRGKEPDIEYIDLRFGNRVYYKMKGSLEVSVQE